MVFFHLAQPIAFLHLIAHLHQWREIPLTLCVQRFRVLAALQEYTLHLVQVVLQTIIVLTQHARTQLDLQHVAGEFSLCAHFQAASALEDLNVHVLTDNLDHFGHQAVTSRRNVANLSLHHRTIHTEGHHVGNDATNSSFCHLIYLLFFSLH